MTAVAQFVQDFVVDNVIEVDFTDKKTNKNKDSNNAGCSSQAGISKEVYAFTTEEEIKAMIDVFDKHIEKSVGVPKQIACRNKMLFLIGLNVGLRASDIRKLKWNFFLNDDGSFKDFYSLQPKKQRKYGKFVKLYFNQTIKKAITDYLNQYPVDDINDYLFKSRKGNDAISENALWRIIKETAVEAGINKNIGSHSLRKSFGYHVWHNAEDKNKALVTLQLIFNHSDTRTTMAYIGLLNNEIENMFLSVDLGLDYL